MESKSFCNLWDKAAKQFPGELYLFINELEKISPKVILEIGVASGHTLKYWSSIVGADGLVIGIDLKIKEFDKPENTGWIEGDSSSEKVAFTVAGRLDNKKIDFLFIDGCHDERNVRFDYIYYSAFVRRGGIIAFHDIDWGGPRKIFNSLPETKHYVDTSTVLPEDIEALRNSNAKKDYAMSRTSTIGWIFKQ